MSITIESCRTSVVATVPFWIVAIGAPLDRDDRSASAGRRRGFGYSSGRSGRPAFPRIPFLLRMTLSSASDRGVRAAPPSEDETVAAILAASPDVLRRRFSVSGAFACNGPRVARAVLYRYSQTRVLPWTPPSRAVCASQAFVS